MVQYVNKVILVMLLHLILINNNISHTQTTEIRKVNDVNVIVLILVLLHINYYFTYPISLFLLFCLLLM